MCLRATEETGNGLSLHLFLFLLYIWKRAENLSRLFFVYCHASVSLFQSIYFFVEVSYWQRVLCIL